ncbi:hypothetical protein HDU89_001537 [Geranomyces variabilis]|nr:hypothetical protein HDU89_001537 [Geranomyces variabilis]
MAPAYDGPQAPAAAQHSATEWRHNAAGDVQPTLSTAYDEDHQYDEFGEDQFNQQEFDLLCQATQPEAFPAPAIQSDVCTYEQHQTFEDEFANPVLSTAEVNDVAELDLSTAEVSVEGVQIVMAARSQFLTTQKIQAAEEKARHVAEVMRLENERAELDRKYQELVNERFAKDGEIKTTRKRLEEAESEKVDLERKLAIQSSLAAKEKAEIEEECKRKITQMQDELRFYFVQNFVSEPDTLDYILTSTRRGSAELSDAFSADIAGLTFDQRAAYQDGMQRLMGNLSRVLTGASEHLSTLVPSLEWLLEFCVEHTVLRPLHVFLRISWLICQHCKRCCKELLASDSNGRPKVMMQCFERLLKTLMACPRRDEWDDSSLQASAHYLFQILGALASSVPHDTSNYKLSNLISGSDMSCILDDRQDPRTCAEALEFCFYLVPDREFIKMLLGPGFQATGRDSPLSQLCKLLSWQRTAHKTQLRTLKMLVVRLLSAITTQHSDSVAELSQLQVISSLIAYMHDDHGGLPPHAAFSDDLQAYLGATRLLLRAIGARPDKISTLNEISRHRLIAIISKLLLLDATDKPFARQLKDAGRELHGHVMDDTDARLIGTESATTDNALPGLRPMCGIIRT